MISPLSSFDEAHLEELLTRPNGADIEAAHQLNGDVIVLGAGGKMGPSLVVRIKRAIDAAGLPYRVVAVVRNDLQGIFAPYTDRVDVFETDLLTSEGYERLPDAPNVIYMVGRKFGSFGDQSLTWATNVWAAGLAGNRFRKSRIVAFSTGNVYPFIATGTSGADEAKLPQPVGEYAQSALGRERIFEYFANAHGTPTLIYRLNYAVDLRYGVFVDIGNKVKQGLEVDVTTGYVNAIWQGDANSYCLRSFALCESPAKILNVTGLRKISVREIAQRFGQRFGIEPKFKGIESPTALLSDASLCSRLLGPVEIDEDVLFDMTADWLNAGGNLLNKPTKFESRDGRF